MLTSSFPSTLSKIYIKGPLTRPFYELYLWRTHATQEEFLSFSRRESKTPQREKKVDAKEPVTLYSEEECDRLFLL